MWSYNDDDQGRSRTIRTAAKELLAEAGVADGFEIDLWCMPVQRPYNPNAKRIAEMMQADLAKVGVNAKLVTYEWGEYRKRLQAGEHQTGQLGWTGDNGDPDNFLPSCSAATPPSPAAATSPSGATRSSTTCVTKAKHAHRPGRAHQALRAGAGDLPGGGALVHDRPFGQSRSRCARR